MGGACSTHCAYNKCTKTGHHTKKRDQLGDIGVDGKKNIMNLNRARSCGLDHLSKDRAQ
jgi:hypothetical protein